MKGDVYFVKELGQCVLLELDSYLSKTNE